MAICCRISFRREFLRSALSPRQTLRQKRSSCGIPTEVAFFGTDFARKLVGPTAHSADLLVGNNVLAHVPDLNDFVGGMSIVLSPDGVITMEFPHLLQLIDQNQFDTIYHEHFSYFSLLTVKRVFAAHQLRIFDVEQLATHGGSLRIFACHDGFAGHETSQRVQRSGGHRAAGGP